MAGGAGGKRGFRPTRVRLGSGTVRIEVEDPRYGEVCLSLDALSNGRVEAVLRIPALSLEADGFLEHFSEFLNALYAGEYGVCERWLELYRRISVFSWRTRYRYLEMAVTAGVDSALRELDSDSVKRSAEWLRKAEELKREIYEREVVVLTVGREHVVAVCTSLGVLVIRRKRDGTFLAVPAHTLRSPTPIYSAVYKKRGEWRPLAEIEPALLSRALEVLERKIDEVPGEFREELLSEMQAAVALSSS